MGCRLVVSHGWARRCAGIVLQRNSSLCDSSLRANGRPLGVSVDRCGGASTPQPRAPRPPLPPSSVTPPVLRRFALACVGPWTGPPRCCY